MVLLVLTISYANSLRIYFAQAQDIASSQAEIARRQQRITDLQAEVVRWQDGAYVRTQARERLGWVVPGETAFQVVGADGKPLGGGAEISSDTTPAAKPQPAWWAALWGSVQTADRPAPVKAKPKPKPPITEDTKPNDTLPTPSPTPNPSPSPTKR